MSRSTVAMPCNYSGYYNLDDLKGFGYLQFDWSNGKDAWVQDKPMTAAETIAHQSALVHSWDPTVKVGVYRNGIKALNWFSEQREKLDDPQYAGWFVPFNNYPNGGSQKNRSYTVNPCTYAKCSGLWHDQTQTPEYSKKSGASSAPAADAATPVAAPTYDNGHCKEECDCGRYPCGEYVFDHRNASLAAWFVSSDGPIINNRTLLAPGVVSFYIDDSAGQKSFKQGGGTGWITETSGEFFNDTGMLYPEIQAFTRAYEQNMETLYDNIVELGGFAWQMFNDGPVLPAINPKTRQPYVSSDMCKSLLREQWCVKNGTGDQAALLYAVHESDVNTTARAEQQVANFLLTRGAHAFIGYDWNGCTPMNRIIKYTRPAQFAEDFGVPLENCREVDGAGEAGGDDSSLAGGSGVFTRRWSKATITWNCSSHSGTIDRTP